jgi:hypothetical protein
VDVAGFMTAANRVRDALAGLGKDRMAELEPSLIPRLQMVPEAIDRNQGNNRND